MKKLSLCGNSFCLLLAAWVLCLVACKTEPDDLDDLPYGSTRDDPHLPLLNPFTGVWSAEGEYWEFRPDGTGGRAATQEGPFPNAFSYFVSARWDERISPQDESLVILEDSGGSITVIPYKFLVTGNYASLITAAGAGIELHRVSGNPQVLSLTNPLIGEWSAEWSDYHGLTWSLKYRTDGTLKTYHHQVGHQFENSYALRRNTLVIYGDMRFGGFTGLPIIAEISLQPNGQVRVQETQEYPGPATWVYTKVNAAKWK